MSEVLDQKESDTTLSTSRMGIMGYDQIVCVIVDIW
jgi:hypothetical protein